MADGIKNLGPQIAPLNGGFGAPTPKGSVDKGGASFQEALGQLTNAEGGSGSLAPTNLKFSNHAIERMQRRGITYSPEQMGRIERAIDKAAAKGSRETLLLTEDSAMIVSVNNRTVVTVMDKNSLKENVFTNIDSTVMI